ncbi:hypothetical protein JST97_30645 [bacterium]|nr:hypothetical protein [bacterium]
MDSFISNLFNEGLQAQPGQFSLDPRARVRRLEKYQSVEPALYLLKSVQVAVGLGADGVDIRLARSSVEVRFQPRETPALSEVLGQDGDLATMLLAALATHPKDVILEMGGQIWSKHPNQASQAATGAFRLHLSRQSVSFWQRFLGPDQSAEVQQSLIARCALCPIPVRLDGRMICTGRPEDLGAIARDHSLKGAQPTWAAELLQPSTGPDHFCLASFEQRTTGHFEVNGERSPIIGCFAGPRNSRVAIIDAPEIRVEGSRLIQEGSARGELRLRRWLGMREAPNPEITLIYIKRGIALDPVRVRGSWPGACCVICREDVATDLSQLKPILDENAIQLVNDDLADILRRFPIRRITHKPFAVIDEEVRQYLPDAERLWNRDYRLPFDFAEGLYPLGPAGQLFNLLHRFDELVTLWINKHGRVLTVLYGSQSEVSDQKLADLTQLTWVEVFQQQSPTLHQLLLRSGDRWLRFSSDAPQLDYGQLETYALRLARRARCRFRSHPAP